MSINIRPTLALREKSQASHSFEGGQCGSTAGVPRQESDRKTLSHSAKAELATAKCYLVNHSTGLSYTRKHVVFNVDSIFVLFARHFI